MFFGRRKQPDKPPAQLVGELFGPSAVLEENGVYDTGQIYPFLAWFGSTLENRWRLTGRYGSASFTFCFPVKLYDTLRQRKFCTYGFTGAVLTLHRRLSWTGTAYAYSGKPFRPPEGPGWQENKSYKRVQCFSQGGLSALDREQIQALVDWMKSGCSALFSPRYAICARNGDADIAFWEPELFCFAHQMDILISQLTRL